jgi:hypothetical protein
VTRSKKQIVIPAKLKPEFLLQLHRLNVTAIALFPTIDGLGRSMKELATLHAQVSPQSPGTKKSIKALLDNLQFGGEGMPDCKEAFRQPEISMRIGTTELSNAVHKPTPDPKLFLGLVRAALDDSNVSC